MLLTVPSAKAANAYLEVESNRLRSVVAERLDTPRKGEIRLIDGSTVSGTLIAAADELWIDVKTGKAHKTRTVPYQEIASMKLDLGPSGGWRALGRFLGVMTGTYFAMVAAFVSENAGGPAAVSGVMGGWTLGGKLGSRHRRWLILEVRSHPL